ncbi:MAG: hypothetical protein AAF665_07865 [Pseudomonadota bacterium]
MTDKAERKKTKTAEQNRDDRLKAALKANLARRKAQSRARSGSAAQPKPDEAGQKKDA